MKSVTNKAVKVAFGLTAIVAANSSFACNLSSGGFFAAVVECAAPSAGPAVRQLDRLNGQMGRPFDRAAAQAVDVVVPGSGAVIQGAWELQRSGVLNGPAANQNRVPQAPQQVEWNNGNNNQQSGRFGRTSTANFPPMQPPMPALVLGNFCATPAGMFGPGPVQPVGSSCNAYTPFGPVFGMVVNVGR
jgi:hypothetical protein